MAHPVITFERRKKRSAKEEMKLTMKKNVLALATAGAIALGGFVAVQAQPGAGGGHWGHAFGLRGLTEKLDLTADQKAKVQPILDQAKPQIMASHK